MKIKYDTDGKEIDHSHIVVKKRVYGGTPIINGTRTSVANVAGYYLMGLSPEEIQRELIHLSLAQIFDALAYYLDHRETIDRELERDREEVVSKDFPAGKYYWLSFLFPMLLLIIDIFSEYANFITVGGCINPVVA
jgi:uncharacterized protein (DUF433 family)